MKQKSNPVRGKGLSIAHKLPAKATKLGSDDDWTEVRAKPSKSNSPVASFVDSLSVSAIAPSINLFSQAPESFFHDEDSPVSSQLTSPAATVKLLHSDLSMNAPSFTPMSEERREPVGFFDALRTHISTHSSADAVAPPEPLTWTYLDPNGVPQGPFTGEQMAGWFAAGYFPPDLPVSWSGNGGLFGALDKVYPSGLPPFLSSPSPLAKLAPSSARTAASEHRQASPPRSRGWLWSPEEDVKLETVAVSSLEEIMSIEAKRKGK